MLTFFGVVLIVAGLLSLFVPTITGWMNALARTDGVTPEERARARWINAGMFLVIGAILLVIGVML